MRALVVVALAACTTPTGTAAQAITNGSADPGDPAVIGLADDLDQIGCTATMIGPHTAITAAHCLIGRTALDLHAVAGSDAVSGTRLAISDVRMDPAFDPTSQANDLGLVTLREASSAIVGVATVDASLIGATIHAVGFGSTTSTATDGGTKRIGTAQVSDVQPTEVTAVPSPAQPCHGDSGGPMLLIDGTIAAVVSRGDSTCSDHAIYARIDAAMTDFVAPYLAATAPGTAATGDACLYTEQCASGPCLVTADDPDLYFCSQPCKHDSDCPAKLTCAPDGCRYPVPSPGALGSPCTSDAACTSAVCRQMVCTISCLNNAGACPADYDCGPSGSALELDCFATPPVDGCAGCATGGGAPVGLVIVVLGFARARRSGRSSSPRDSRARRS
ncbi:MAG: trypsin-like serine protease [Kofleriaceae bacterium]